MIRRLSTPLLGPDATNEELALSWGAALLAGVAQAIAARRLGYTPLQLAVAVALAVDVGGGVVVNSTHAGRAYWHRPAYRHRALFFAAHLHPFVLAALWPSPTAAGAAVIYLVVMLCAAITTRVSRRLALPVAVALTGVGVVLSQPITLPAGLAWMPPLLLLKLVVGHAVAPFEERPGDAA